MTSVTGEWAVRSTFSGRQERFNHLRIEQPWAEQIGQIMRRSALPEA